MYSEEKSTDYKDMKGDIYKFKVNENGLKTAFIGVIWEETYNAFL
ncbi:MAG: hypothetical protein QFX38_07270 [Methanothermobacter sp.]|nr:hypothetical protein [Methanothermobacter sp.]